MGKGPRHPPVSAEKVVKAAGGPVAISDALGIHRSAAWLWVNPPDGRPPRIPAGRVLDMERMSGFSRHQIRPDIYGPAPEAPRAKRRSAA